MLREGCIVLDLISVRSYGGMRYYKLQNFNVVREDGRRMKYEKKTIRTENIQLAVMTLFLFAPIPAVYQTVKTFLISSGRSSDVFDIIGQMEWFGLFNEILQAFLIVPIYSGAL